MMPVKPTPRWPNIELLIKDGGDVSIGRVGPVRCVASAADPHQQLAMLARRPRESFEALLTRLDEALESAVEHGEYIDEVNG